MATGSSCKQKFESGNDLKTPPRADIAEILTKTRPQLDPSEKHVILDVIEKTLKGGSLLVMMASDIIRRLCFLVAAYFHCQQFRLPILFISPLLALIERKGMVFRNQDPLSLRVACLHDGAEIRHIMKQIENRKVDVLLLTPEMLEKILLCYKLPPISFACIDSAECVLNLQAYRLTYLRLNKLLRGLVGVRCLLGLSALATESTTTSLTKQFEFEEIISGCHSPVIPRNIQLCALCGDYKNGNCLIELFGLLNQKDPLSVIVLCDSEDNVKHVFKRLQKHFSSFPTCIESADTTDTEMDGKRQRSGGHQEAIKNRKLKVVQFYLYADSENEVVRDGFESDQIDIVVTTPDFGMGLTRADAIIYCFMPQTYESLGWGICHVPRNQPGGYVYVLLNEHEENNLERFRCSTMKIPGYRTIEKQVQAIFKGTFMKDKGINDKYLGFILASLESDGNLELPGPISDCHHLKQGYRQPNQREMKSICKKLQARLVEQATSSVEVCKELYEYLRSSNDLEMLARKFSYGKQSANSSAVELVGSESMKGTQERRIDILASTHRQQPPVYQRQESNKAGPETDTTTASQVTTSGKLDEEDLFDITTYLAKLDTTIVYNLGQALGLSQSKVKHMKDSDTFLDDVIAAWLRKEDYVEKRDMVPTWRTLVKALKHPRIGQNGIANHISMDKRL